MSDNQQQEIEPPKKEDPRRKSALKNLEKARAARSQAAKARREAKAAEAKAAPPVAVPVAETNVVETVVDLSSSESEYSDSSGSEYEFIPVKRPEKKSAKKSPAGTSRSVTADEDELVQRISDRIFERMQTTRKRKPRQTKVVTNVTIPPQPKPAEKPVEPRNHTRELLKRFMFD